MNKMERDTVLSLKPKFYRRLVVDTYKRRMNNEPDELFSKMNFYHLNINVTIEINPSKFPDTKTARNKNELNVLPTINIASCLSVGNPLCQNIRKRTS